MICLNEMTKEDHKILKGIAVTGMVMLHLFCRLGDLPYKPIIWIKETPLIYYLGLFGDVCVPAFAFLSGYAHYLQYEKEISAYQKNIKKLSKFILNIRIVVCFVSILGLFFDTSKLIPGSGFRFIKNLLLIDTYAGAWWYIDIYILLVLCSLSLFKIVRKNRSILIIILSFGIYAITYYLRFHEVIHFNYSLLNWVYTKLILFGNTLFSYLIGMIYRKHTIISKLKNQKKSIRAGLVLLIPVSFAFHCFFQSVSIAPLNAFILITDIIIVDIPKKIKQIFGFLGIHSTNIWLLRMFCYLYIFPGLVFKARYPIFIVLLTIGICCIFSVVINYIMSVIRSSVRKENT